MAGNKKPRKQRTVRASSAHAGMAAIARRRQADQAVRPMPGERQTNVCIAYYKAIEAMTGGYAEGYHLDTIIYALAIGVVLLDNGLGGDDAAAVLLAAMDGVRRTKERYLATGAMGLDGAALVAIRAAYPVHEWQMREATMGELQAAINEMHRRVAGIKTNEEETA